MYCRRIPEPRGKDCVFVVVDAVVVVVVLAGAYVCVCVRTCL